MTAIMGFTCTDGILLFADTEEAISRDSKSECDKLQRSLCKKGTVLIGGAGDSHFVEYETQKIISELLSQEYSWLELHKKLEEMAVEFVRDKLSPYSGLRQEPDGIALLIAYNDLRVSGLFRWEHDAVKFIPRFHHACIGSGVIQMHPMLYDVQFSASCGSMLIHGIRIMMHTKRIVSGVGGRTEAVAMLDSGGTVFFGTEMALNLEKLILDIEQYNARNIFAYVSEPVIKEDFESRFLESVPSDIKDFRNRYQDILKDILTPLTREGQTTLNV